jgi:hypothetical protein
VENVSKQRRLVPMECANILVALQPFSLSRTNNTSPHLLYTLSVDETSIMSVASSVKLAYFIIKPTDDHNAPGNKLSAVFYCVKMYGGTIKQSQPPIPSLGVRDVLEKCAFLNHNSLK